MAPKCKKAMVKSLVPTEACFPLLSSSASIHNLSIPQISHTAEVMTGD